MVKEMLESAQKYSFKSHKPSAHWQYFYMGPLLLHNTNRLALYLNWDVSHTDLLQPHFIGCKGVLGTGGSVVIKTIYSSQSRFRPQLSGIRLSGLMSGVDFQMMHWYLTPSRNTALDGGNFCNSIFFSPVSSIAECQPTWYHAVSWQWTS